MRVYQFRHRSVIPDGTRTRKNTIPSRSNRLAATGIRYYNTSSFMPTASGRCLRIRLMNFPVCTLSIAAYFSYVDQGGSLGPFIRVKKEDVSKS